MRILWELYRTKFIIIWLQYLKNMYIEKLDGIVNKHSNAYHSIIKMKPIDVKSSTYIDLGKKTNKEDPKFKVANCVRISKYKTFLRTVTFEIDLKKLVWFQKLKILFRGHMLLVIIKDEGIIGTFYKKQLQKTNKKELNVEKVIKRKVDKLYVKWKC